MESYAQVLQFAFVYFIIMIIIEEWVARKKLVQVNRTMDTISSLSSGLTNVIKDILGLTVIIISYSWMVDHLALFEVKSSIICYILAFIGLDFAGYWTHRFNHTINIFWNRHLIHHSSEEFNLSCALRQSISTIFAVFFFLLIPMALIGIPAKVVAITAPIHLFAQFWYHTRLIDKMGILEHIIVTPSHHRVHHAINDQYLDKNFAQIFIVWDKWFGTFQEELKEEPPVYGVKRAVATWNPFLINIHHIVLLISDAWHTQKWSDKLKIWFMPTGWRPVDVTEKHPVSYVINAQDQVKYETESTPSLIAWSWFQLVAHNVLLFYMMSHIADIPFTFLIVYGLLLGLGIFSYTSLMDRWKYAYYVEAARLIIAFSCIYWIGSWFHIDQSIPYGTPLIIVYFVMSFIGTYLLSPKESLYTIFQKY